jgi:hypothetical protein
MEELAYSLEMTSGRGVGCELTDKRLCSSFLQVGGEDHADHNLHAHTCIIYAHTRRILGM